jgi:hypothetical protein
MLEGAALGYELAGLHSTAMGEPVYRSLGFVTRCTFGIYQFAP